ncbi:MAG: Peptide chain release factor 2 [Candidatus Woesebacteria bacterium GW2011_GWA1_37_8]|uniref:Peptide chain release factor 2 n=2 Tax=Candidatus Woeseibacteriota TaxID=1752722 RepID=A0A0G0L6H3_9BACT|nr:MAG: Peptide chain release factor 2 [Microgenomates group bacterium GW2011_GWC1_37_12b]KKQ46197.1 MAG: Peptide chain release factor 2 [Candidatus Woesebacteria bacterium GW2011_GWA1_37_8]KKQ87608.1 MAG: Peptide chain release factor 2 [Candidatus Woesebacteria bacterium GW2011_GWB1_38_8b]
MNDSSSEINKLQEDFGGLVNNFGLEDKQMRLKELEAKSTDPNLWDDQENARAIMQELGDLKNEIEEFKSLKDEIQILAELTKDEDNSDLSKEFAALQKRFEKFKIKSYLSGPFDKKNALVTIHAGQGGTEAMDWSSMLFRMYSRFCERKGWDLETIAASPGEEAGFKSITFRVSGSYVYGYLKGEGGTHRLVRQSPFNADKLRQTSFALVEVLPEFDEADLPEVQMNDEDLDWQFYRSGGHGGQNVNKVSTAVRLTHKPSGIVVTAQTERFQERNRMYALNLLRAKLWALETKRREENIADIKGEYRPASWGNQIRSYVLHPYKMVKDLRTDYEVGNAESVLDGDLDGFIEEELKIGNKN